MPHFDIVIPLVLSMSIPVLLFIFGRFFDFFVDPGRRFKTVALFVLIVWAICKWIYGPTLSTLHWFSGFLLISGVLFFSFMLWSVLSWGYTTSMLLSLQYVRKPVDLIEWQRAYAGEKGLQQLTTDRLGVLFYFRLVTVSNDIIKVTKLGSAVSKLANMLSYFFGINLCKISQSF